MPISSLAFSYQSKIGTMDINYLMDMQQGNCICMANSKSQTKQASSELYSK
jgi:ABC-type cobalt transport system substrate-binding protein